MAYARSSMETHNPYSPPSTEVADTSEPAGRPALVWIIVVLLMIGSLGAVVSLAMRLGGYVPDVGGLMREQYWYDFVIAVAIAVVRVLAAVSLFRLKRIAWPFFMGLFVAGVALVLYHLAAKPIYRSVLEQTGYWGVIAGLLLSGAMTYYVYRLHRDGVLRS